MNTTNDGGAVNPMVMKAALGLRDHIAPQIGESPSEFWATESTELIAAAQAALTACGALECLDALERLARLGNGEHYGNSDGNMIARDAIAKATTVDLYGSAPE